MSQKQEELLKLNKKHFSFFSQVLSFRHIKQASKNVMDATFKVIIQTPVFIAGIFSKLKVKASERR